MSLTVLFDLDDTLLGNRMDQFLPAYIHALNQKFSLPNPELLPIALSAATGAMLQNQSPFRTLSQVFDDMFYPMIQSSPEAHHTEVVEFYEQDFPHLKNVTHPIPGAQQLLEQCVALGHTIAIATNPLFPRAATLHRIEWAGIDLGKIPLSVVSTYEDFHFAKPRVDYYLEMLCRLNWAERAVMVGNDFEDDILPAARLGLPTYWITQNPVQLPTDFHHLSDQGALSGVRAWLETVDRSMENITYNSPEILLSALKASPAFLHSMARSLSPADWNVRPIQDEWSLVEILCHLRDVDQELNLPRIRRIIEQPGAFIRAEMIDDLAESRNYNAEDHIAVLEDYFTARGTLLETLTGLEAEMWNAHARHSIYGPTSLRELVELMLAHDQAHTRQFAATMQQMNEKS